QSDQQVPITPDACSDNAGQITGVQKAHIRFRRFEVKLDFFRHRNELLPERRGKGPLIEISKPKSDRRSGQCHDRARPVKPIRACYSRQIKGECAEQPRSRYQETQSNNCTVEPRVKRFDASFACAHFWLGSVQGPAPQDSLYRCPIRWARAMALLVSEKLKNGEVAVQLLTSNCRTQ